MKYSTNCYRNKVIGNNNAGRLKSIGKHGTYHQIS